MAYLTIITGTHEFYDMFGYLQNDILKNTVYRYNVDGVKFKKKRFDRVVITEEGEVVKLPPVMAALSKNRFSVVQTMGSGKTILGAEHIARVHKIGGRTGANLGVEWFPSNKDKKKEQWVPNINSIEDMQSAKNITALFDDIKGTIKKWNSNEADLISAIANASRKEGVNLLLTTQRVINFVPKDIREVATNYEIPYITIRDMRKPSPDSMGYPLEMEVFNISANDVFMGFGVSNGLIPDGKTILPTPKLLNCYSTLEIARDLSKGEETTPLMQNTELEPYKGYNNEVKVIKELEKFEGTIRHLSAENPREHDTDILFYAPDGLYHIDAIGTQRYNKGKRYYHKLNTESKDAMDIYNKAQAKGVKKSFLAFEWKGKIRFLDIKHIIGKSGACDYSQELRKKTIMPYAVFRPRLGH